MFVVQCYFRRNPSLGSALRPYIAAISISFMPKQAYITIMQTYIALMQVYIAAMSIGFVPMQAYITIM